MDTIKLDIDNKDFKAWENIFLSRYVMIWQHKGLNITSTTVKETKKGWHIYLTLSGRRVCEHEVLCLENFFGSDQTKQFYAYCEGNDILFAEKNGHKERFDYEKSNALYDKIKDIKSRALKVKMGSVEFI